MAWRGHHGFIYFRNKPYFFLPGAAVMTLLKHKIFSYAAPGPCGVCVVLDQRGLGLTGSFYTLTNIYRAATSGIDELALLKPERLQEWQATESNV